MKKKIYGKSADQRFWNLLKKYRSEIRQVYIYALFIGAVNLTLPLGIQAIINFLQMGEMTSTWLILVCFVLGGMVATGVLQVLQLRIVENIQQDLFTSSAFEFAYRLPRICFIQLDKIHAPELVNRFFDTLTIQKGLPKILTDFSSAIFQLVFGLILLTIYSPFFILLGVTLALILLFIFRVTGPKGLKSSLEESKYKYQLAHWLEEIARCSRSFKIRAKAKFRLNKTDDIVSDYLVSREDHFKILISQFELFIGFKIIVAAGLLLLGGYLVFQEQMSIGQFVAAEIIIILIINSIEKVLRTLETIYDVLTALDKIGYVTDLELDKDNGKAAVNSEEGLAVRAKEIVFSFPDQRNKIINNLSFEIRKNEKVVLAGKSGSGKSLLLRILMGMHQIQEGELYIDKIPFSNYERDLLYENLGVSFPTNQIFEGTIRDNILLGLEVEDEILADTLEFLHLNEYILHQPQGLDSFVDTGGRKLPRSIIQKLLIARIVITKPKLLLMEDPLLFIEEAEKKSIIDYIMAKEQPWTVLVISDFHYWKTKSDRILELHAA